MQPTARDLHINRPLTNISTAYIQSRDVFVSTKIFPNIPTENKSDIYLTYDRGNWYRDEMQERAPATESEGSGFNVGQDTYNARVYAFHKDIDDQLRATSDNDYNLDADATEFVTQKALLKREKVFVQKYMKTGVWHRDIAGVGATPSTNQMLYWNLDTSLPISGVRSLRRSVVQGTGYEYNTLVLGRGAYDGLLDHPTVVDRIKYSGRTGAAATTNTQVLRELFEIDNIYVMNAIENKSREGQADDFDFIAGNVALLCYVEPNPGKMKPSAGYTFSWNRYLQGGPEGEAISRFRMQEIRSDRIEIELAFDMKVVSPELGLFISPVVAPSFI